MIGESENMDNNFLDIKIWITYFWYLFINTISNDKFTTGFTFVLVSLFTVRRWWLMEKRNKNNKSESDE